MLLLEANRPVSRDRLIDGLWGAQSPPTAQRSLETYISRLRALLGADRIVKRAPGYLARIEPGELDLDRFEGLVERSRAESRAGDLSTASRTLEEALGLWRGLPLADLIYEPFALVETERLEELRMRALEERIDADLELGGGAALVQELETLVRAHPLRERQIAQLMLALYRAGRQADALAVFRAARQRLVEALGLEPGLELQALHRQILERDPSLTLARPQSSLPTRRSSRSHRRRLGAAALVGVVIIAVTGIVVTVESQGTRGVPHPITSSGLIALNAGPYSRPRALGVASAPAAIATAAGTVWLADAGSGALSRVDLGTGRSVDSIPVGGDPGTIAIGGGSIWSASVPGDELDRVDPATGKVTQRIPLGAARASALSFANGAVWVADLAGSSLIEVDAATGAVRRTLALDLRPTALALARGAIWVASYDSGTVEQVDLRRGETITTVHVGNGPVSLAVTPGSVWVANALDSTVSRIETAHGTVAATIPVGSGPSALAVDDGDVWVASEYAASVSRIDPARNVIAHVTRLGGAPTTLAASDGTVYVGLRPLIRHRGGTLVLLHTRPISIDPALQFDLLPLQSDALTRDGLVTYNHVSGPAGIRLVPDLAVSLPAVTDGGTTYTFRLRPGIRYSDGRPVRAADFRRALERVFRLASDGSHTLGSLVGVEACQQFNPIRCDLSRGISTDEVARTVTFHLSSPDPDFLSSLTAPFATPVPPALPSTTSASIPSRAPGLTRSRARATTPSDTSGTRSSASGRTRPGQTATRTASSCGSDSRQLRRSGRCRQVAPTGPPTISLLELLPAIRTRFASQDPPLRDPRDRLLPVQHEPPAIR